ncbi:MAG: phosphate-starvation-inducible PsiE family protein [Saccharolobus sp.]|uniref:phosphate-starvation-inducible PsiE family protein n=1 Tax=Saccharolobus TaxID=2100760 RepID=UPI001F10070D|nr:phosphate-starvation-inducible PsiE family protein [Saccharolobus shibatae]MCH4814634.1 phosphate-starvation-inducible PsiE family protein [Saccharolobus shibatae]
MARISDKDLIKFIGYIIRVILLFGIGVQIILTIYGIVSSIFSLNLLDLVNVTITGPLLILVLLELYIAVNSYLSGKERSIINVIDAGISFFVRELILELFSQNYTITHILIIAGVVGILSFSRFITNR